MNIQDALYKARAERKTKVLAEDQQGNWKGIVQARNDGFILYVVGTDGRWFIPQQWKEVVR